MRDRTGAARWSMSGVRPTRTAAGFQASSDLPTRPGARLAGAVAPASLPAATGLLPAVLVLSPATLMAGGIVAADGLSSTIPDECALQ